MKRSFEQLAVQIAVRNIFETTTYFCVVNFRRVLEIAGVTLPANEDAVFAILHCVAYGTMSDEMKLSLKERALLVLGRNPEYQLNDKFEFVQELDSTARGRRFADMELNKK